MQPTGSNRPEGDAPSSREHQPTLEGDALSSLRCGESDDRASPSNPKSAPSGEREPDVGEDEPRTPTHSLPSYDEPTPETHRRLTREEEAELALTRTGFSAGARWFLIIAFVCTIAFVPAVQLFHDLRSDHATVGAELAKLIPTRHRWLPHAESIKAAEKSIERESVVSNWLLPRMQAVLTGDLGAGNEQAYLGRDGWLFYRPDVEYVTGPAFLDPARIRHRALTGIAADSIRAITEFRDQLAARGIELIVLPAPAKPTVEGDKLSAYAGPVPLQNRSFAEWKSRLESEHVRVFDPAPLFAERKQAGGGAPQYLATDSHWRPEAMELVADRLAQTIAAPATASEHFAITPQQITAVGDIGAMLKLPPNQTTFRPETVTIHEITARGSTWRPSKDADVLLLGDSFANIYSLGSMGWGESAGLAEHLSRALGDRPLDCIVRNSDGAFATREMLHRELARGRDRLAGKRWVIWEFAARELSIGDWKRLPMKLEPATPALFFTPKSGEEIVVTGTVESISPVPRPGSVPYKDHILSLHLVDISTSAIEQPSSKTPSSRAKPRDPVAAPKTSESSNPPEALVYMWSMRDNIPAAAANIRAGDRVTLKLKSWSDVSSQYEKFNRSELDDPAVQLEEPAWGEIAQ